MALTVCIYDLSSRLLADISSIALENSMTRNLNGSRTFVVQAPASESLLTANAYDAHPNLMAGNRKLIVWESTAPTQPVFHGRIFLTERSGDGTKNTVTITACDPFMELGFDPDRAGRPVRALKANGGFINPSFTGTGTGAGLNVISGPELIYQVLTNSQQTGVETDPTPGEGPLPIDLTGTFNFDMTTMINLSPNALMSWPLLIGDFINNLTRTGVCDFNMRPVDPTEGRDPYVMVEMSSDGTLGTDRSATVHFDYWTGSKNAGAARHSQDFKTVNNKLYDYLGPPVGTSGTRWTANITPSSASVALSARILGSRALYGGPGLGQFMSIRISDTVSAASMPLAAALWNAEQGYRCAPRDLLYVTPAPDTAGLYDAPGNFDVGDTIAINVGSQLGVTLAETQRVYGYVKTWDRQGVRRLSELLTSADVSLA